MSTDRRPTLINESRKAAGRVAEMKVISYNLLNHKVETGDDHHVHPDGSPVFTDEFNAARLGARLALIARWMDAGHTLYLQEVPSEVACSDELQTAVKEKGYTAAFQLYNYKKTGATVGPTLGLMTLLPPALELKEAALLLPFNYKHFSPEQAECMKASEEQIAGLREEMEALKRDPVLKKNCGQIQKRIADEANKIKALQNSVHPPPFGDRPLLVVLARDAAGREVCLVNMHMPCQHRNPAVELQNAMDAKREVTQYLAAHAPSAPFIFGGDLNCLPGHAPFNVFSQEWTPVFPLDGEGYATTYGLTTRRLRECLAQGCPVAPTPYDLDHFFTLGVKVLGHKKPTVGELMDLCGGLPIPQLPDQPSDHVAVEMDIAWPCD